MRPSTTSLALAASIISSLSSVAIAAGEAEWKARSIYQVMTDRFSRPDGDVNFPCDTSQPKYCGGTWQGIINELDYIQGMGFTAIYISPIIQNIDGTSTYGEAYHGYWPQNFYEVNDRFGTRDDLIALSKALHDRDMYLMVDVVVNDMAFNLDASGSKTVDYSNLIPFNNQEFYHAECNITDYGNYTDAQVCWLDINHVALPDLDTENPQVVDMINGWVQDMVANYSVDGLRVDAAKHVGDNFLQSFAQAAGVFTIGEVYEGDAHIFCHYQDLMPSMTDYPNYFPMIQAFTNGNISALAYQLQITKNSCKNINALASFSENHDLPRFASFVSDPSLIKSAIAWTILNDGIPMIYQGQEQGFNGNSTPLNREALWHSGFDTSHEYYQFTATMNKIRNHAIKTNPDYLDYESYAIYSDDSTIVLRKGFEGRQVVTVLSNSGSQQGSYNLMLPTAYASGEVVVDVVSCTNFTVTQDGKLNVPMGAGVPHVFFPVGKMNGSEMCGITATEASGIGGYSSDSARSSNLHASSSIAIVMAAVMAFCLL